MSTVRAHGKQSLNKNVSPYVYAMNNYDNIASLSETVYRWCNEYIWKIIITSFMIPHIILEFDYWIVVTVLCNIIKNIHN